MHLELAKNASLLFFQHWFGVGSDFCMLLVLVRSAFCSLDVVSRQSSPPSACVPSHLARDHSPLYSPSLHLNLTHPHRPPLCAPPPHLYSPILPGMYLSPVARLSRTLTPNKKDSRELERALRGL
jgi:hypothetical protein